MRVELHPEARAELRSTAFWYDERRPGLGASFINEVSETLTRIGEAPLAHVQWPGTDAAPTTIRRAVVVRFPYLLAFEVHADLVLVLAVAHAKRRPLYWLARATQTG